MGMLNAKNVFGVPAMASSFFNIGSIAAGALFGWLLDPGFGERALVGLSIGTLVGGFLQLAIQPPSLRRVGYTFRPDFRWKDPAIRKILLLMVPSVIAASASPAIATPWQDFALASDEPWEPRSALHVHGPARLALRFRAVDSNTTSTQ